MSEQQPPERTSPEPVLIENLPKVVLRTRIEEKTNPPAHKSEYSGMFRNSWEWRDETYARYTIFGTNYSDLVRQDPHNLSLADILENVKPTECPPKKELVVNMVERFFMDAENLSPYPYFRYSQRHPVREGYEEIVSPSGEQLQFRPGYGRDNYAIGMLLTDEQKEPDMSKGVRTKGINPGTLKFLVFALASGKEFFDSGPINNFSDLKSFAQERKLEVDPKALWEYFSRTFSRSWIEELVELGGVDQDNKNQYLGNCIEWMSEISTELLASSNKTRAYDPFPLDIRFGHKNNEDAVEVPLAVVPNIVGAYYLYFANLPSAIKEGEYLSHSEVHKKVEQVLEFVNRNVEAELKSKLGVSEDATMQALFDQAKASDPTLAKEVAEITMFMNVARPLFIDMLKFFQAHPEVLNKKKGNPSDSEVKSYKNWRDSILNAGGDISKKHGSFVFRHGARKSQI